MENNENVTSDINDDISGNETDKVEFSKIYFFIDVFLINFLLFFILFYFFPTHNFMHIAGYNNYKKSCHSNIRVLSGIVEMFNEDQKQQQNRINTFDEKTIKVLKDSRYLKSLNYPLPLCKYLSKGNLASNSGIIYCECHGDVEGKIKGKFTESEIMKEISKKQNTKTIKEHLNNFLVCFIPSIILVCFYWFIYPSFVPLMRKITFIIVVLLMIYSFFQMFVPKIK